MTDIKCEDTKEGKETRMVGDRIMDDIKVEYNCIEKFIRTQILKVIAW